MKFITDIVETLFTRKKYKRSAAKAFVNDWLTLTRVPHKDPCNAIFLSASDLYEIWINKKWFAKYVYEELRTRALPGDHEFIAYCRIPQEYFKPTKEDKA